MLRLRSLVPMCCLWWAAGVAPCAQATEPPPIVISSDAEFTQKLLPYWQQLPPTIDAVAVGPHEVSRPEWADKFVDASTGSRLLESDHHVWYRFKLRNPESTPVELVVFNYSQIYSLYILQDQNRLAEIGYGTPLLQGEGLIFPAFRLMAPPGDSTVYLGIHSRRHPVNLNFHLRSPKSFVIHHTNYLVLLSALLIASVAVLLYTGLLFFGIRSRLYVYYLVSALGLLVLELCITGALAFFGKTAQADAGNLWIYAAAACFAGAALFMLEYFEFTGSTHPAMRRMTRFVTGVCVLSAASFGLIWRIALPILGISVVGLTVLCIVGIAIRIKTKRRRALLFVVAFAPPLLSAMLLIWSYANSDDSQFFNSLFCFGVFFNTYVFSFLISDHIQDMTRTQKVLEASLKSVIPPAQLKRLASHTVTIDTKPAIRHVTIMFVDIVGYSLSSRKQLPMESFYSLKDILHQITKIIHEFGGIIDKSLGDGCLCFFGYDMAGGESEGHELLALNCALEMQRRIVARINDRSAEPSRDIYPLRIGVNTASVCIGNMGDESRFDFTMTGEGVVLASRFETACEPFKVMVGKSTFEALSTQARAPIKFYQRLVPVKHTAHLVEAYEINPFEVNETALERARAHYWNAIQVEKRDERIYDLQSLVVGSQFGFMTVVNFSINGFCLLSDKFLGKGVEIQLELRSVADERIHQYSPILVQVAWGGPSKDDKYLLGTRIVGLSENHRQVIFTILKACIENMAAPARVG